MNWSACQFPRRDKKDQSSTWRSANSTRSVVGFCSCCLMLTACTRQVSTATWRSRHRCDSQLFSPSLPPFAGESNYRKRLYAQTAHQRRVDENVSVNAQRRVHGCIHVCALLCILACVDASVNALQAYTQRPRQMRTLPCVKLQTFVSHYVSNCWRRRW